MNMPAGVRKFWLTVHVATAVGFAASVAAFLALGIAGRTSASAPMVSGAHLAMDLTTRAVIVPLCLASLLTGLVSSLGTPWGLFRHYRVLVKLVLTVIVTVVLVLQLDAIGFKAQLAAETSLSATDFRSVRQGLVWPHASGGLAVQLLMTLLSTYKPQGLTRYGWRKLRAERPKQRGQP